MTVDGVLQWQPTSVLQLAARAGLLDLRVGQGRNAALPDIDDRFDPSELAGLVHQPRYFTAGVAAAVDSRDDMHVPTSGGTLGVAVWRFVPLGMSGGSWTRIAVDWREYVRLAGERHVAAVRVLASTDHHDDGSQTPFYLQYWLGGSRSLRGFHSYRFRGQAVAHLSAEYRWWATKFIEVAPFVDIGAAAARVGRLTKAMHVTPGIGVRVRTDDHVLFRFDAANGSDGHHLHFSVGSVF
jgi:outer membrane protein assembly factor BamA